MSGEPARLRRNSRERLDALLDRMLADPAARQSATEEIERDFAELRAVLVLDMTGFSRTTRRSGIVAFLLMIHQMKSLACPAIEANGGLLVKAEADNLYCLFESVADAVAAARGIKAALENANLSLAAERHLYASVGIGYGRILNVDEEDMFGDEVNFASKLGEDIAGEGEILLTPAAAAEARRAGIATAPAEVTLAGVPLDCHLLVEATSSAP